jgi:hypothetical protein
MLFVRISLRQGKSADYRRALDDGESLLAGGGPFEIEI